VSGRRFKRMVVGLPQGMGNSSAVQAAADLAEFLQVELLAAFVADTTLLDLAGFPAMREWRILDQQWQPLDVNQISRDLEKVAEAARQRFAASVGGRNIRTAFDVFRSAELMSSLIEAGDIVTIIEPSHPGESITRQFTALLDAAFQAASAILVVPKRIIWATGPIMVQAAEPHDPSIRIALEIAAAMKDRLIVVLPPGMQLPPEIGTEADRYGVVVEQLAADPDVPPLLFSPRSKERLRVVPRGLLGGRTQLFSKLHGVPLLIIESGQTFPAAKEAGFKASSA